MKIKIKKFHSYGNDFILVDKDLSKQQIINLCERRYGVGADGLIVVNKEGMKVYNLDGNEANMCGNGLRCVSHYMYKYENESNFLEIKTATKNQIAHIINVNPFTVSNVLTVNKKSEIIYDVSGTRHLIVESKYDFDLATTLSKRWNANISFFQMLSDHSILLETYEIGALKTLACGTATCACAYYLSEKRRGNKFDVYYNKGYSHCIVQDNEVHITGESHFVFEGEVEI